MLWSGSPGFTSSFQADYFGSASVPRSLSSTLDSRYPDFAMDFWSSGCASALQPFSLTQASPSFHFYYGPHFLPVSPLSVGPLLSPPPLKSAASPRTCCPVMLCWTIGPLIPQRSLSVCPKVPPKRSVKAPTWLLPPLCPLWHSVQLALAVPYPSPAPCLPRPSPKPLPSSPSYCILWPGVCLVRGGTIVRVV